MGANVCLSVWRLVHVLSMSLAATFFVQLAQFRIRVLSKPSNPYSKLPRIHLGCIWSTPHHPISAACLPVELSMLCGYIVHVLVRQLTVDALY